MAVSFNLITKENPYKFQAQNDNKLENCRCFFSLMDSSGTTHLWDSGVVILPKFTNVLDNWIGPFTIDYQLQPNTSYKLVCWRAGHVGSLGSITISVGPSGSGDASSDGNPRWRANGAGSSGDPGPYPINDSTYSGQTGIQVGIGWAGGGTGYFQSYIKGTGHKYLDSNTKYTDTYDANHHGTGDYVKIDLEGDCSFSNCSWCYHSIGELSTDTSWGTLWYTNAQLNNGAWPPGYNPSGGLLKDLVTSNLNNMGPESGLTNDHAAWNCGRGTYTTNAIERTLSKQIVTYYAKHNMDAFGWAYWTDNYNGAWGARHEMANCGSVATIKFEIPRLDLLVKVVSSNGEFGSAYFQIANGVDESTGEYTFDSTHYTERYLPIGTHIKLVADVTETGKFIKFSNDINQETSTEVSYEIDITDELVLDKEGINFTANFEAGQFEIKVDKNEFITTVSKNPINSQGLHVDWYNVNETITFRAEVFERDDEHFKAYVFDKWEIKYKDGTSTSVTANPFIGTSGVAPLNKSCTVTAIARLVNTSEYRIDCPRYYADGRLCRGAYSSWDDWKQSMVFAPNEIIHLRVEDIDSNYRLDHWEQSTDGEIWVELWNNPTKRGSVEAGEYHVFKPIFEVVGSTASILSPDDGLNAITQPVWIDNGKPIETNKRFIGVKDPNGVDWETLFKDDEDKIPKLGDFFFMIKPKKDN